MSGYGVPTMPISGGLDAGELAALRGGGGIQSAAMNALPSEVAAASGGEGLLSRLGAAGFQNPMAGGVKGALGNAAKGFGFYLAGQGGAAANNMLGGPPELSGALQGAGTGAGIGMMFGAPGAGVGAVIGGAAGALQGPISDLGAVEDYNDVVDKFVNVEKHMPDSMKKAARHAALQIHNDDSIPLGQKATVLKQLIGQMRDAKTNKHAASKVPEATKAQLKVQQQMADAMAKIGEGVVTNGDAAAATIRASIPGADPRMAAMMENDAMTRSQRAREIVAAQTGATYMQPQIDRMDAQLAQLIQLRQQLSQQGGGQSLTQALAK